MNKVSLIELTEKYKKANINYQLPIILGVDEGGKPRFSDLTELKHILMTGLTGSGKSMFMHTMISTFLSSFSTHQLRLLLVDMKMVELLTYEGSPYLLSPVIVRTDKVYPVLQWLIDEKDRRLRIISELEKYPSIIVFIDTFSHLMSDNSVKFQKYLSKLMDKAANVKIHLIMSDSRPSPDIFTTLIRNFFPTKICFNVSDSSYSELIIGKAGGEKLRGAGDMLISLPNEKELLRIQAPYIPDDEIRHQVESIPPREVLV